MDIRLKQLSYSSRMLLASCPRKYQLTKYNVALNIEEDENSRITLAFGTVVGLGVQLVFQGMQRDAIIIQMFLAWPHELGLFATSTKHKKSFFLAVIAIDKMLAMRANGLLKDYELLIWEGKPATELSFRVDLGDGFSDRGFLDMVLKHKETGEILCVEIKTDSAKYKVHEAKYGNSPQALGYSIVLDRVSPGTSSYKVLYIIYFSELLEYELHEFIKSPLAKAEWIQNAIVATKIVNLYESAGVFPKHGQSCLSWNRPCKYYGVCNLSDSILLKPITEAETALIISENEENYQLQFNINTIIDTQLDMLATEDLL